MSLTNQLFPPYLPKFCSLVSVDSNLIVYGQGLVRLPDYLLPTTTSWYQAQLRLSLEQVVDLTGLADLTFSAEEVPVVLFWLVWGYLPQELPVSVTADLLLRLLDLANFLGWVRGNLTIYGHSLTLSPEQEELASLYTYLSQDIINSRAQQEATYQLLLEIAYQYPYTSTRLDLITDKLNPMPELDKLTLLTAIRHQGELEDPIFDLKPGSVDSFNRYLILNGVLNYLPGHYYAEANGGMLVLLQTELPVKLVERPDLPLGLKAVLVSTEQLPNLIWREGGQDIVEGLGPSLGSLLVSYLDNRISLSDLDKLKRLLTTVKRLMLEVEQSYLELIKELKSLLTNIKIVLKRAKKLFRTAEEDHHQRTGLRLLMSNFYLEPLIILAQRGN